MPDTGAPWNIPFAAPADLVRDWPDLSEDVALAVASGLNAAGGLVAVKHVLKTDTFSASITAGSATDITGLSITHAVADDANRLIFLVSLGNISDSGNFLQTGFRVFDGTNPIAIGNADGSRTRVTAGGQNLSDNVTGAGTAVQNLSMSIVHAPGVTSSLTYTVQAVNVSGSTRTCVVNRSSTNADTAANALGVSSFVLMEVKV
jgi:hypothetical protein